MSPLLLSIFALIGTAHAKHQVLSWKPFTGNPQDHGWKLWCTANALSELPGHDFADYRCKGDRVAVWNAPGLPGHALEIATPCGSNGYALGRHFGHTTCPFDFWVACIGDSSKGDCYGFAAHDDGTWPSFFNANNLPDKVEIWAKN